MAFRRARAVPRVLDRCIVKANGVDPSARPRRFMATMQSWADVTPMPPNSLGTAAAAKPLCFRAVMFSTGKVPLRSCSAAVRAKSAACFSASSTIRLPGSVDALSSKSKSALPKPSDWAGGPVSRVNVQRKTDYSLGLGESICDWVRRRNGSPISHSRTAVATRSGWIALGNLPMIGYDSKVDSRYQPLHGLRRPG